MTKNTKKEHYVNNKDFLAAMTEYRNLCNKAKKDKKDKPLVTDYIGECFLKIANHLSYRPNFINYTFRDDMISDGIENCLQYLDNFDPSKSKNPFAYFTQICYYAFLRRIAKEKKQQDIKLSYLERFNIQDLIGDGSDLQQAEHVVESLRQRIDRVKESDKQIKEYARTEKKRKIKSVDSDLSEFLE